MVKVGSLLFALCLTAVAFSGCAGLFGPDSSGSLARIIEMSMDESMMDALEDAETPEELMDIMGTATYIYTHEAGEVATADVLASFTDDQGRSREPSLADFTTLETLKEGDTVEIDGVAVYSPLVLSTEDVKLASRGTSSKDWFTVDGYPMPVAGSPDSGAAWTTTTVVEASSDFDKIGSAYEDTYNYQCRTWNSETSEYEYTSCSYREWSTTIIEDLDFDATMTATQTTGFSVAKDGVATTLEVSGGMDLGATASFTAYMTSDGGGEETSTDCPDGCTDYMQASGDGILAFDITDAEVTAEGTASLFFEEGNLVRAGAQGSSRGEITITAEGDYFDNDWTAEIPDPLFDESFPYEEETFESSGEAPDQEMVEMLSKFWGMDLKVGDEFHVDVDASDIGAEFGSDDGFRFTYSLIVVEREDKEVSGTTFDALRMQGNSELTYTFDGETFEMDFSEFTYWIGAKSYTPVFAEVTYATVLGLDDIELYLDAAEEAVVDEDTEFYRPTTFAAAGSVTTTVEATEISGDFRMPAIFAISGLFNSQAGVLTLPMFGAFVEEAGYESDLYEESPPNVSWHRSADDSEVTVVYTQDHVYWSDLDVTGCENIPSGEVSAGQTITGCEGTVQIYHRPSNAMMFLSR